MAYDKIYHSNSEYLTDYSGFFHAGMQRKDFETQEAKDEGILYIQNNNKLLDAFDKLDKDGNKELSLREITEEAQSDAEACRSSAKKDLMIGAIPGLFTFLSRKNPKIAMVWSLFIVAAGLSAGSKFYNANKLEKDIEKFNNNNNVC